MKATIRYTFVIISVLLLLTSCVQKTKEQTILFEVDTSHQKDIISLEIRGGLTPLSWKKGIQLDDADGDGIYTGSVTLDVPYDYVELKFVKNETEYELKGQPNRKVYFDKSGTTTYTTRYDTL